MERQLVRGESVKGRGPAGFGWWWRALGQVARRPALWPTAMDQAFRLARPGWWRRPPFLPLPDPDYVRFRMQTAYGSTGSPDPADLVAYLSWCREFRG